MENKEILQQTEIIKGERDWFLQTLVNIANKSDLSIGLTIITHGFLVSGEVIGGKTYFEKFGEEMGTLVSETTEGISVSEHFKKMGDDVYSEEKIDDNPSFIHFKNAKFFQTSGEPIPNNRGVLWRGKISEVSGYSLGKLSKNEE